MPTVIRIEAAGRFFERSSDGIEVELGVTRTFEPARRLVLDWYPGTGSSNPTEVEVRFEAIATGTRITVSHGPGKAGLDAFGVVRRPTPARGTQCLQSGLMLTDDGLIFSNILITISV